MSNDGDYLSHKSSFFRSRAHEHLYKKMTEQEYIPVKLARERMSISPGEMLMLLDAGALRCRKDRFNRTVTEVCAEDVREAAEYLTRFRHEERERMRRLMPPSKDSKEAAPREVYYFNIADGDLLTLLLAAVSYFDAERDLYFVWPDERGSLYSHAKVAARLYFAPPADSVELELLYSHAKVAARLYGKLEKESKAGRPLSEIVEEIFERRPDQPARSAVYGYLMDKVKASKKV